MMKWKNTDGWDLSDMTEVIAMSNNYSLADSEKRPIIAFASSAASKVLTLGLADGQGAIIVNTGGTNAVTVKNVSGDTGTSVAAGKCALVIGSSTADGSTVLVLN